MTGNENHSHGVRIKLDEYAKTIEKVEDFIKRIHDLDLVIKTGTTGADRRLSASLGNALGEYEVCRGTAGKVEEAIHCIKLIDKAYAFGLIMPGKGMYEKIEDREKQNKQLKKANEQLEDNLEKLKTKYQNCKKKLETWEKRFPQIGDLEWKT